MRKPRVNWLIIWSCVPGELYSVQLTGHRAASGLHQKQRYSLPDQCRRKEVVNSVAIFQASNLNQTELKPNNPTHFALPAELKSKL